MNDQASDPARLAATIAYALALADEAGEHLVGAYLSAARDALEDRMSAGLGEGRDRSPPA